MKHEPRPARSPLSGEPIRRRAAIACACERPLVANPFGADWDGTCRRCGEDVGERVCAGEVFDVRPREAPQCGEFLTTAKGRFRCNQELGHAGQHVHGRNAIRWGPT